MKTSLFTSACQTLALMKTTLSLRRLNAGLSALWLTLAAFCALLCPQSACATAYTLNTLTSGLSWATPGIWTPAGPPGTVPTDVAILPLGGGAWTMTLDSSPIIAGLTVTNSAAMTLNVGTPSTGSLTLHGAAPAITNISGQTFTINPGVNLDTANAILTASNNGTVYIVNPGGTFFSNLNPAGGLNVGGGTLQIGNVTNNLPPLSNLKTGSGQLTLNLTANLAIAGSFFTNQTLGLGGTGTRVITGIVSFTNANGAPLVLTNNSTSILELDLSTAVSPTNFFGSLGGISSISGKNGNIKIKNISGTNNLGSVSLNTSAANQSLLLFGNGSANVLTNVFTGGSFSVNELALLNGLTLNVDSQNNGFTVNTLTMSSGNSGYDFAKGAAIVNWNASGKSVGTIQMNVQGGDQNVVFNMLGGSLTNSGGIGLGSTSHNTDNSTSTLNVSGGVLAVTNSGGLNMSPVSTLTSGSVGPKEYSFLTITNTGIFQVISPAVFKAGSVTVTDTVSAPIYSQSTISLGGGTLQLGTPIARQPVAAMINGSSANWVQFNFNGGTLQALTNLAQVFTGFGTPNSLAAVEGVYVMAGGAVINNGGFNVGISNALLQAASSTGGGLTNLGTGTLTLSGANTYTGPTVVSAGKLVTTTTSSFSSSGFSVADGATNQMVVTAPGSALSLNSLTLGTSAGATMEFNTAALGNPTTAIVALSNPLTLNGTVTVNIYGTALAVTGGSPIVLMTYPSETVAGAGFTLGSLPLGVNGTLTDNGTQLVLTIISANNSLTWNGNITSAWDIGGVNNWLGQPSNSGTNYAEVNSAGLPVTFDDNAAGSTAITLGTNVHPASITITNNTLNYSITGAGTIGSVIPLTKTGNGTFTLGVTNNFTSVTLNAGTLGLTNANNRLPVTDTVTFGGAAALDLGGNSQSITNLVLSGLGSGNATVTNGSLTVTLAGGLNFSPAGAPTGVTTEDLSGLNTFTFNQSGQQFYFYGGVGQNSTLKLAGTNTITTSAFNLANGGLTAATLNTAAILLGQSNVINTAAITMGGFHNAAGSMVFNPLFTNPTLTLRGTAAGGTPVGSITVGNNNNGTFPPQVIDTSAGSIDAVVGNLYVVNDNSGGGSGTLSMSNGTLNVGAINVNNIFGSPTATLTATFNQKAGTVLAGSLGFNSTLTNGVPTFNSAYNLGSSTAAGLLSAKTIYIISGTNSIGGTVASTAASRATINFTNGTIENYDPAFAQAGSTNAGGTTKTNLIISGLAGGGGIPTNTTLNIVLAPTGTHNFFAEAGYSITETNTALISGSGSLTANGPGSVILYGTNTYTGNTTVSAGTLEIVLPVLATNSIVTVAAGAQLKLDFSVTNKVQSLVTNSVALAPGYYNFSSVPSLLAGSGYLQVTGSTNAYLTSLVVSNNAGGLALNPTAFATGNYGVYYATNTSASPVTVTVTSGDLTETNTLILNGTPLQMLTNGVPSGGLTLAGGTGSTVVVQVVSQSGAVTNLYTVDVQQANTAPPLLNFTTTGSGSSLLFQFNWTGAYKLQSQTNTLSTGLSSTGWHDYPAGGTPPVSVPADPTQGTVFFRLSQ